MPPHRLIPRISVCVLSTLFSCLTVVHGQTRITQATDYRQFLGDAQSVPDRWSPTYQIRYNDRGFTSPRAKVVRKSTGYIENHGGSQDLADQFEGMALEITNADPDYYGRMIDQAYASRLHDFQSCGGRWAEAAETMDISALYILIEPTIFQVNVPGYFVGAAGGYADLSSKIIRVVNVYPSGIITDGSTAWLVSASTMVEWELGNELAYQAGYVPRDVNHEMGSYSPCNPPW